MMEYSLLDQASEDALHKSRLLNVEEKPFKRITKRLFAANAAINIPIPTSTLAAAASDEIPGAEGSSQVDDTKAQDVKIQERRQWREDMLLDFEAFNSSIVRIQFLLNSNAKERERYAVEKENIQATAQKVKENTTNLYAELGAAQKTLALRKEYDELAETITKNESLRPQDEQARNIARLHAEIAELNRESKVYAETWNERRHQFERMIEEGMQLRRLIRGEKEEEEEGMGEGSANVEDDENSRGADSRGTNIEQGRESESGSSSRPKSHLSSHVDTRNTSRSHPTLANRDHSRQSKTDGFKVAGELNPTGQDGRAVHDDEDMAEDGEVSGESGGSGQSRSASPSRRRSTRGDHNEDMDIS